MIKNHIVLTFWILSLINFSAFATNPDESCSDKSDSPKSPKAPAVIEKAPIQAQAQKSSRLPKIMDLRAFLKEVELPPPSPASGTPTLFSEQVPPPHSSFNLETSSDDPQAEQPAKNATPDSSLSESPEVTKPWRIHWKEERI